MSGGWGASWLWGVVWMTSVCWRERDEDCRVRIRWELAGSRRRRGGGWK